MIRLSTLFWLVAVATAGFAMFAVKYEVQSLADELAHTVKQTDDTSRDIRVLDAEWAYLNRPDALAQMNQRFLSLVPIATKQLRANIADLPMRPAPPPPPAPTPAPGPIETVSASRPAATALPRADGAASDDGAAPGGDGLIAVDAVVPSSQPAETEARPANPPAPSLRPVRVALDTRVAGVAVRPVAVKAAARTALPRRPASLDALIAQISESR
jgi:hypothetical protein